MSQAHYEAVQFSSNRPYTLGNSRKSFLPFRLQRTQTSPDMKTAHRFSHPNDQVVRQLTHEHVLLIGDRVLTEVDRRNQLRMQQTYQQLLENERKRMEREYQLKSDEMTRKWKAQLNDEKIKLQKEFDGVLADMEKAHQEKNLRDQRELIRRMKNECDQALAKQWKIANEQLALAVKQAEDQLRALLELKYLEDKERYTQELIAKKNAEYTERELKTIEKVKIQLRKEHDQTIEAINEQHRREMTELNNKLKLTEERFHREFSLRAKLESDFRLLQTDYKRFMDHSNVFHSDYMLKLYHIGEQIGDDKFEQVLDRVLAEANIETVSSKPKIQTQSSKSKHALKLRNA